MNVRGSVLPRPTAIRFLRSLELSVLCSLNVKWRNHDPLYLGWFRTHSGSAVGKPRAGKYAGLDEGHDDFPTAAFANECRKRQKCFEGDGEVEYVKMSRADALPSELSVARAKVNQITTCSVTSIQTF